MKPSSLLVPALWLAVALFAILAWLNHDAGRDARAEVTRLTAARDSAEVARDSVTRWADSTLAERDTAMARERAEARRVIAVSVPIVREAERVLTDTTATPDTLRATIRSLLWTNEQLSAAFLAHVASDSVTIAKTDSVWQTRVDAERAVTQTERALGMGWAKVAAAEKRKQWKYAGLGAGLGALACALLCK